MAPLSLKNIQHPRCQRRIRVPYCSSSTGPYTKDIGPVVFSLPQRKPILQNELYAAFLTTANVNTASNSDISLITTLASPSSAADAPNGVDLSSRKNALLSSDYTCCRLFTYPFKVTLRTHKHPFPARVKVGLLTN